MSKTVSQNNFIGGMTALFDSTKTADNAYRIGLNCRARKNGIQGAFKPVKVKTPAGTHQAVFALDNNLLVMIGGRAYKYLSGDNSVTPISGFPSLDSLEPFIHHVSVPAPTNSFVTTGADGAKTYVPAINKLPEVAILQDGSTQPSLVFGDLSSRSARTYAEWTYDDPEYVPIGRQMCYAAGARKLFVAAPDGKRIYQSVSGRGLDFVLNFNDATGAKQGDAESSSTAVAANSLVALVASQTGGFVAFTRAAAYTGTPDPDYPLIFGEPYVKPGDLFPVGSVGHLSFTSANGESVFVSPGGIQSFNEVAQLLSESNNTAFGAPIIDFLVRPITRACAIRADNYTFFGLDTIFGSGIAVFDNQIGVFVSFDLVGAVKEFAVLDDAGLNRVFYITYTDELYELPLYAGERAAFHVYIGELASPPDKSYKPTRAVVSLNNLRTAGVIDAKFYVNRELVDTQTRLVDPDRPEINSLTVVPVNFPTEGETVNVPVAFTCAGDVYGQAIGLELNCPADAVLTGVSVELEEIGRNQITETAGRLSDEFVVIGDIRPTSEQNTQSAAAIEGRAYYFYAPSAADSMMNGDENITVTAAYGSKRFVARTNVLFGDAGTKVYDFSGFEGLLTSERNGSRTPILLGGLGYTDRISPILAAIASLGKTPYYVTGPWEHDSDARLLYALGYTGTTQFYVRETDRVRMFFLGFPMNTAESAVDANGAAGSVAPEMLDAGPWHATIQSTIAAGATKFNIIFASHSPYAIGRNAPGVAAFRWNFKRLGVHAVITGNSYGYYRTYVDGVHYITAGTGNTLDEGNEFSPIQYSGLGALRLSITASALSGEFADGNAAVRDRFFIPL